MADNRPIPLLLTIVPPYEVRKVTGNAVETDRGWLSITYCSMHPAALAEDLRLMQATFVAAPKMIEMLARLVAEATAGHVFDTTAREAMALIKQALTPLPDAGPTGIAYEQAPPRRVRKRKGKDR